MPIARDDIDKASAIPIPDHPSEVCALFAVLGLSSSHLLPGCETAFGKGLFEFVEAGKKALLDGLDEGITWSWRGVFVALGYAEFNPKTVYRPGEGETEWSAALKNWVYLEGWRYGGKIFKAKILRDLVYIGKA